jgi:trk system potassium uptake protein TrkH
LLIRNFRSVYKNEELRLYLAIISLAVLAITFNILPIYQNLADSIRTSFFQVASIMTTTGFATADFNAWPAFSKAILLIIMFFGASGRIYRWRNQNITSAFDGRMVRREMLRLLHPRSVGVIKLEEKRVDDDTLQWSQYLHLALSNDYHRHLLLLSLDGVDFETNFSSIAACLNNIGPGFGLVGPWGIRILFSFIEIVPSE